MPDVNQPSLLSAPRRSLPLVLLLCGLLLGCSQHTPDAAITPAPAPAPAPTPSPAPSPAPGPTPGPAPTPAPAPSPAPAPVPGPTPTAGPLATANYPYAITLSADRTDTASALEALYHAKVIELNAGAGYALLAAQSTVLPKDPKPRSRRVEDNHNTFNGGGLTASITGSRVAWVTGDLQAWGSGSRVAWVTGEYVTVPGNSRPFKQIGLEAAQGKAPHLGAGVTVAVIDTGLDLNHAAFAKSLVAAKDMYDFYNDDPTPQDEGGSTGTGTGHGTAVAGIVLEVAPRAKIMPLRALGPDGGGDVLSVARAVDWATAHGASVINLSLGSAERSDAIQDAVTRAAHAGVLVVIAAGNDNRKGLNYPAAEARSGVDSVREVSVGSVGGSDVKSSFSNYGPNLEVTAPGENIFAPYPGNMMASWSGTSMAAPIVAGVLALALGDQDRQRNLTDELIDRAKRVDQLPGNAPYRNMLGVKGRVDAADFMRHVVNSTAHLPR